MPDAARILVVDDEQRSVELLVRTLRDLGSVHTALSGREAWELASDQTFDLVVSDQRMPGMSGVELLARVADREPQAGRILITAYTDIAATIDAINHGRVHAYLAKPWSPDDLRLTAGALLERVRGERERDRLLARLRGGEGETPEILVIASSEPDRKELLTCLESLGRVRAIPPAALSKRGPLVDAAAAVALLRGNDPLQIGTLLPLRDLPAAKAIVLVTHELDDERLENAIRLLDPIQVLPGGSPAPALRLAVRRALPPRAYGRGARLGHRRAPALLGVSAAIREVADQIRRVANSGLPVLVLGETGTGKELVARAIHAESSRSRAAFVAVNCGALPDTLLESELFGFHRGAFTGADRNKRGLFEEANGGTLFLDEIGDTSLALQAKLLRAIEQQEIRPLGSTKSITVDVRIVSATHRDLNAAVETGAFRQDLFFRLNTVTLHVPPLRRRRVDIPFLAQHFAEEFGEIHAREITLGEDFLDALTRYHFPGNVRELRNAVERAIALTQPGEAVTIDQLAGLEGSPSPASIPAHGTLRERLERVEVEAIREALAHFGGNRTRAADALGLSRHGFRQKLRRFGLEKAGRS